MTNVLFTKIPVKKGGGDAVGSDGVDGDAVGDDGDGGDGVGDSVGVGVDGDGIGDDGVGGDGVGSDGIGGSHRNDDSNFIVEESETLEAIQLSNS